MPQRPMLQRQGNYSNWAMHSFFGRVNLNWDEKYLFEANLRMDNSSRFAAGKTEEVSSLLFCRLAYE